MIKVILILLLVFNFPLHRVVQANIVCAETDFVVSNIVGHNQFERLGCFSTFADAQNAMRELQSVHRDLIITHHTSPSPLQIVSASRAIATSYPFRLRDGNSNNILMIISRSTNLSSAADNTFIPAYHDFRYIETISYNPVQTLVRVDVNGNIEGAAGFDANNVAYVRDTSFSNRGVIRGKVSGFEGFVNIAAVDIIPLIYVENNWTIMLGGNTFLQTQLNLQNQERPYTIRPRVNEYRVSTNANGLREIFHENWSFFSGNTRGTYLYGPAPEWLPNGRYFSFDGIHFFRDLDLQNPVMHGAEIGQYFNYFTNLPFRTTSNITGAQLDEFLETVAITSQSQAQGSALFRQGRYFVEAQNQLGMNALLVYAMALHESNRGLSTLAVTRNNLFGWGAKDANPGDAFMFSSVESSIFEHSGINLRGFLNPTDWRYFGQAVGNKNNGMNNKYASDPYWGQKIAGWAYRIDRHFNFIDMNYYPLIVVTDTQTTPIHRDPAANSPILHTIPARNQQRFFVASEVRGDWIMTPTLLPLNQQRQTIFPNTVRGELVNYDFSHNFGFIRPQNFRVINHSIARIPNLFDSALVNLPSQATLNSVAIENDVLVVSGTMSIPHLGADASVTLTPHLRLTHATQTQLFALTSTPSPSTAINLNQTRFGFTARIPLQDITLRDNAQLDVILDYRSAILTQTFTMPVILNTTQNATLLSEQHQISFNQVQNALTMNIENTSTMLGDMNNDGRISITDVVILHRILLELDPTTPWHNSIGDMNNDARISITDVVILHRTLLGLDI